MRFLLIDDEGAPCSLAYQLQQRELHEVKMFSEKPEGREHLNGIVAQVQTIEQGLGWLGKSNYFIRGDEKDCSELRQRGYKGYGGNLFTERIENDRQFEMEVAQRAGIPIPNFHLLENVDEGIQFLKDNPDQYCLKQMGHAPKTWNYVGHFEDGTDVIDQLEWIRMQPEFEDMADCPFMLQEFVEGIEFAVTAFWQYTDWLKDEDGNVILVVNKEHKKEGDGDTGRTCFSSDTELLTKDGWKKFDKVTLQDEVASCHYNTLEMFYEKPEAIIWKDYVGELLSYKNRYVDLLVTPDHKMFGKRRKTGEPYKLVEAQKTPAEFVVPLVGKWRGKETDLFYLPAYKDGRGYTHKEKQIPMDAWIKFLGIYLSEGNTSKNQFVIIAQLDGNKCDEMRSIIQDLGFNFCRCKKQFKIYSCQLANYLKQFGYCNEKFVPTFIKDLSVRQIDLFINAYVLGDGCRRTINDKFSEPTRRITTTSKKMADDVQELFLKIGSVSIVGEHNATELFSKFYNDKWYRASTSYTIEESTRKESCFRGKTKIKYSGKVGCVTVPTSHLIFVRRNGRVSICGNCGEMGTVARFTIDQTKLFAETLDKLTPILKENAPDVCVAIDANCGVIDTGECYLYELTPRTGYPISALIEFLLAPNVGNFFIGLVEGNPWTGSWKKGWGVVTVLGAGMYPDEGNSDAGSFKDQPVRMEIDDNIAPFFIRWDADKNFFRIADDYEYVLGATFVGDDIIETNQKCVEKMQEIDVRAPHYRHDIGTKFAEEEIPILAELGYL